MNTRRVIFLSVFGAYQLVVFLFTFFMESKKNDLGFLLSLFDKITWFKYGALIGVLLLVVEFIWAKRDTQNSKSL